MALLEVSDFWTWRGRVGRTKYLVLGVSLFAAKHFIDRMIASAGFGLPWSLFNYWVVGEDAGAVTGVQLDHLKFYATLVAVALPFIWVGVSLTLRRLRDIGWPLWLAVLFFVPFLNLLFFLVLSAVPSHEGDVVVPRMNGLRDLIDRIIPKSGFGSAVVGVLVTTLLTILATVFSVYGLGNYGWGLFVGLPFFLGFSSVVVYGYHEPRTLGRCLLVALLSVVLTSAALIAVAVEGVICVFMAAPLGMVFALVGGVFGFIVQRRPRYTNNSLNAVSVLVFALPAFMFVESVDHHEPALREVRTSIEINAPPQEVWNRLIAFNEIPPPEENVFKTGIAYPVRAEIYGEGVGAVRHCIFTTGAFVEPIEVWDEPRLLKFSVRGQPPVMEEMSPYSELHPPHLENYLQSRRGQFSLIALPNGRTLLEGTTWYQNSFWPGAYWGLWSDDIIHRIHLRVLDHIRRQTEAYRSGALPPGQASSRP